MHGHTPIPSTGDIIFLFFCLWLFGEGKKTNMGTKWSSRICKKKNRSALNYLPPNDDNFVPNGYQRRNKKL